MLKPRNIVTFLSVLVAVGAVGWGVMQRSAAAAKPAFSLEDYMEIQQLYARYAHVYDLEEFDAEAWADTFTSDGGHGETKGRQALIEHGRASRKRLDIMANALNRRHWNSQLMITPTPEGADGTCFLLMVLVGGGDKPPQLVNSMVYHDKLVKTKDGWRFKQRDFVGEKVRTAAEWQERAASKKAAQ